MIYTNLRLVFPDKDLEFYVEISRKYYGHLSRILAEMIQLGWMSKKKLVNQVQISNPEIFNEYTSQEKKVILLCGHFGNWEYAGLFLGLHSTHPFYVAFKPLSNKYFDQWYRKTRNKWGNKTVATGLVYQEFKKVSGGATLCLVADQTPPSAQDKMFTFFGHNTYFHSGAETMAKRLNAVVFYGNMYPISGGKYHIEIELLHSNAASCSEGELMNKYIQKLEESIKSVPENWLWSHRRWKRTLPY